MITKVSTQYANALFEIATEKNEEVLIFENLKIMSDALFDNNQIIEIFKHPNINLQEKKDIIANIFEDKINSMLLNFIYVLIDNARFLDLPNITKAYQQILDEKSNKLNVNVRTNYPLDKKQRLKLSNKYADLYNKEIIINEIIDETLIGGIIVSVDKTVTDYSVKGSLTKMKEILKESSGE